MSKPGGELARITQKDLTALQSGLPVWVYPNDSAAPIPLYGDPGRGPYHTACDSLEAAISARVAAGKEPGPQGSLVEAIEWAYRRLDMLEAAVEGAVSLAVENERLKMTMRNLPEVKVFGQIMTERIDGINRQLLREHTLLLKALKSVQGMCTGAIRSRIDKVITACGAHG